MGVLETTIAVLKNWAGVANIADLQQEICFIWATGPHTGVQCSDALPALIKDLKAAFSGTDLSGLRVKDMTGNGKIKTVTSLLNFIATSPAKPHGAAPPSVVRSIAPARFGANKSDHKAPKKKPADNTKSLAGKKPYRKARKNSSRKSGK